MSVHSMPEGGASMVSFKAGSRIYDIFGRFITPLFMSVSSTCTINLPQGSCVIGHVSVTVPLGS